MNLRYILLIALTLMNFSAGHSLDSDPKHHNLEKESLSHSHEQHQHHHQHQHEHKHEHEHEHDHEKGYFNLSNWSTDIRQLTFTSVIVVSLPSIPTFLFLTLNLFGGKKTQLINENLISKLIAFSFGTLIGDVFLHILPHLLEGHINENHGNSDHDDGHNHSHTFENLRFYFYILGGIMFFIFVDFLSIRMYCDSDEQGNHDTHTHNHSPKKSVSNEKETADINDVKPTSNDKSQVLLFLFGDFLHNLTDGIALGASYSYSIKIGLSTTLAILMHETPHEIGDFAYLIKKKYSLKGILGTQFITSLGCLLGAFIGLYYGEIYKEELLSLTAGAFLYMCLSGIFPDIRESFQTTKGSFIHFLITMTFIFAGIGIMFAVTFVE